MTDKTPKLQNRNAFWQKHLEAWADSGLSQAQYCQTYDLALHQFGYWRRKALNKSNLPTHKTSGFVPVQQTHSYDEGSGLSIMLPNGLTIRGIDQNNLAVAAQLIQVV